MVLLLGARAILEGEGRDAGVRTFAAKCPHLAETPANEVKQNAAGWGVGRCPKRRRCGEPSSPRSSGSSLAVPHNPPYSPLEIGFPPLQVRYFGGAGKDEGQVSATTNPGSNSAHQR